MNDALILPDAMTADEYRQRVAAALSFLPPEEREEILGGVGEHLREVSAEGTDLVERLGTPEAYARELSSAAGLGDLDTSRRRLRPGGAWRRLKEHRWTRSVAEFMPTLRPAWWVLRGYLIVVAITMAFEPWPTVLWWSRFWLIPSTGPGLGEGAIGVLLLCLAIPISISVGRRSLSLNAKRAVVAFNTVLVALGGYAFVSTGNMVHNSLEAYPNSYDYTPTSGLRHNGAPIRNIVVFGADGKPLTDVRLFDQNGDPITVQPGLPRRSLQRSVDEFGVESRNTFPLVVVDRTGEPIPGRLTMPVSTIPALKHSAEDSRKSQPTDEKKSQEQQR